MEKLTKDQLWNLHLALTLVDAEPKTYKCKLLKETSVKELQAIIWKEIKSR